MAKGCVAVAKGRLIDDPNIFCLRGYDSMCWYVLQLLLVNDMAIALAHELVWIISLSCK